MRSVWKQESPRPEARVALKASRVVPVKSPVTGYFGGRGLVSQSKVRRILLESVLGLVDCGVRESNCQVSVFLSAECVS